MFEFRCESKGRGGKPEEYGPCIPMDWLCDTSKDCNDGSDEIPENCKNLNTTEDSEFQCKNKRIINKDLRCNQMYNCGDGRDEVNCTENGMFLESSIKCLNNFKHF